MSVSNRIVSFRAMENGTREDYELLDHAEKEYAAGLPGRVLEAVRKLDHSLAGYPVSRLGHCLQAATRALNDGADDELIVAALIHDVGDELAPYNHAEIAAGILRPYVRPEVTWIVEQHGLIQTYYYVHHTGGDRYMRERLRGHKWFDACVAFCHDWDQVSFDPDFPTRPLEVFEPYVNRVFSRQAHDPRYTESERLVGAGQPG
jgi:predicted HD phosphohydrolase